jgi:2-polyprenyl-3-methyl-5-hydroxy-6-metoxy-1,4-benzoquinol methylase
MRGTAILVGRATAASSACVVSELAAAAHRLDADGVTIDAVLVAATPDDPAVGAACAAAAEHALSLTVLITGHEGAWATQRRAFDHVLAGSAPDFLVTLDAAGHHDARQLPDLVQAFRRRGSGVTIGSRWIGGGSAPRTPLPRRILSRLASRLVARATRLRRVHDITTSFRVIRADAAHLVATDPVSRGDYGFYCEFVAVAQAYGFEVHEEPITFRPRFASVAPLRTSDLVEFAADLHRIRRKVRRVGSAMHHDQAAWASRSARMRPQAAEVGSQFGALEELGSLSEARHFTDWIVAALRPALGDSVLEVGAGFGAISCTIADRVPGASVVAIEPAGNVYATLAERTSGHANVTTRQVTSNELAPACFDSVVYVNVLEHIEDDVAELRTAYRLTRPGGSLALFVPAMPSLYGSLDYKSGHYRRYTPHGLRQRVEAAGFVDVSVRYFDLLGVVPYWLMYRVFDVQRLGAVSSGGYDRIVVPLSRVLERLIPTPRGKNLVVLARRPTAL